MLSPRPTQLKPILQVVLVFKSSHGDPNMQPALQTTSPNPDLQGLFPNSFIL